MDDLWALQPHPSIYQADLVRKLTTAGYNVSKGTTRKACLTTAQRIDQQLPCYNNYSTETLRKFCVARKMPIPPLIKHSLINSLEKADQNPRFERFLDLPAEVRCLVYRCYMEHLPETLFQPSQPPVSQINNEVRDEVLPLFYKTNCFELGLCIQRRYGKQSLAFTPETDRFLWTLDSSHISHVRHFRFRGFGNDAVVAFRSCIINFQMGGKDGLVVEMKGRWNHRLQPAVSELAENVEAQLEGVFKEVGAEEGKKRLQVEDVMVARRVLEELLLA